MNNTSFSSESCLIESPVNSTCSSILASGKKSRRSDRMSFTPTDLVKNGQLMAASCPGMISPESEPDFEANSENLVILAKASDASTYFSVDPTDSESINTNCTIDDLAELSQQCELLQSSHIAEDLIVKCTCHHSCRITD